MLMSPRYRHDCPSCKFLASTFLPGSSELCDWYICPNQRMGPSIIGRMSDEGPDYWSSGIDYLKAREPSLLVERKVWGLSMMRIVADFMTRDAIARGYIRESDYKEA